MGVLADFYVARESRAAAYDSNPEAFSFRASYKNITILEVTTLWAIVLGREWNEELLNGFESVLSIDNGERTIFRIPASAIAALAGVDSSKIPDFAAAWARTDELNCTATDVEPIIHDLAKLSRQASEFGSGVYLWNCV